MSGDVETLYELPMEEEIASVPDEESQRSAWRYDFSVNGIDEQGFPFAIWNRLTKTALLDTEQHMFVQGQARGETGLREVLREYLHYARGVECSAAQIVIGAGNDYLFVPFIGDDGACTYDCYGRSDIYECPPLF